MAETNGEQLIRKMDTYLSETASEDAENETALPFETLSDYLNDPNGFGDVTAKLLKKVNVVFDLAVKYNRHSSDYLKCCAQLEKGIKYLGSSCLQKYALENKKHIFPDLGQLNTANLYTMASVQFNKIDRALTEYIEQKHTVDDALLDMEYRFYHLMQRIRATEVKIYNYNNKRFYGQEDYSPVIHGLAFSGKSWTKDIHKGDEPMAFQRARAFSAIQEIKNLKSENKSENEDGRAKNNEYSPDRSLEIEGVRREQFSKKNSDSGAMDTVNEHGTIKNEEISRQPSNRDQLAETSPAENEEIRTKDERLSSDNAHNNDEGANEILSSESELIQGKQGSSAQPPLNMEVPEFIKILERVSLRSRVHNLDYLAFTEEEMRQLTADPGFEQFQPQMAEEMRKALLEHDSG